MLQRALSRHSGSTNANSLECAKGCALASQGHSRTDRWGNRELGRHCHIFGDGFCWRPVFLILFESWVSVSITGQLTTSAKHGKGNKPRGNCKTDDCIPANRHTLTTCTQGNNGTTSLASIQYLFAVCKECGGAVKVIASIDDTSEIKQILAHLQRNVESKGFNLLPKSRGSTWCRLQKPVK